MKAIKREAVKRLLIYHNYSEGAAEKWLNDNRADAQEREAPEVIKRISISSGQLRYCIEGHDETIQFSTASDAGKTWELLRRIEKLLAASTPRPGDVSGAQEPPASLLRKIQDALVEAFYDPDLADPSPEVVYAQVDWVGVIQDARKQIDKLKSGALPLPGADK